MNKKLTGLLVIAIIFIGLNPTTAIAKDIFYYLGYGLIQVVDGDTDAIVGDIPVDGWIRESDSSRSMAGSESQISRLTGNFCTWLPNGISSIKLIWLKSR